MFETWFDAMLAAEKVWFVYLGKGYSYTIGGKINTKSTVQIVIFTYTNVWIANYSYNLLYE